MKCSSPNEHTDHGKRAGMDFDEGRSRRDRDRNLCRGWCATLGAGRRSGRDRDRARTPRQVSARIRPDLTARSDVSARDGDDGAPTRAVVRGSVDTVLIRPRKNICIDDRKSCHGVRQIGTYAFPCNAIVCG